MVFYGLKCAFTIAVLLLLLATTLSVISDSLGEGNPVSVPGVGGNMPLLAVDLDR